MYVFLYFVALGFNSLLSLLLFPLLSLAFGFHLRLTSPSLAGLVSEE